MRRRNASPGFSLVEMMIAIAISVVVMAGMLSIFSSQQKHFTQQSEIAKSQNNTRQALFQMERDIRMAGYTGVPLGNALMAKSPPIPGGPYWSVVALRNEATVIAAPARSLTAGNALPAGGGDAIEVWGNFRRQYTWLTADFDPIGGEPNKLTVANIAVFNGEGINRPGWVIIGDNGSAVDLVRLGPPPHVNPLEVMDNVTHVYTAGGNNAVVAPVYRRIYYLMIDTAWAPPAVKM